MCAPSPARRLGSFTSHVHAMHAPALPLTIHLVHIDVLGLCVEYARPHLPAPEPHNLQPPCSNGEAGHPCTSCTRLPQPSHAHHVYAYIASPVQMEADGEGRRTTLSSGWASHVLHSFTGRSSEMTDLCSMRISGVMRPPREAGLTTSRVVTPNRRLGS